MKEKEQGWVKFFSISKNYGFIVYGADDEKEIFFSGYQIKTIDWIPKQGQGCRFQEGIGRNGKKQAEAVTKDSLV